MRDYTGKRVFDVVASMTACAVFTPLAVTVAFAIWLEDGGSPLFVQTRVGRARRPFEILKFRSMRHDRVTHIGRWLRRTGLDELPQFINVLRGEMSVVGPRPLTSGDVERLGWSEQALDWRFECKPGITGPSQLFAGQGAISSQALDRAYVEDQSLMNDARLVALSFAVNVLGKRRIKQWLHSLDGEYDAELRK